MTKFRVLLTDNTTNNFSHLSVGTSAWLLAQFPDELFQLSLMVRPFHELEENNASILHFPQCQKWT